MVGAFEWVGINCYGLEAERDTGVGETKELGMGMMKF